MDELTHLQIFVACFLTSATSSLSAYAFQTVDSGVPFEWKKAAKYPVYFGMVGVVSGMFSFDYLGGRKGWYKIIGLSGLIGLGVLKIDTLSSIYGGIITTLANRNAPPNKE